MVIISEHTAIVIYCVQHLWAIYSGISISKEIKVITYMQLYQGTERLGVLQLPIHKEACKAEIQKAAHDTGKS